MLITPKKFITEDWAVVILGFLIILLAVTGIKSPVPAYNWSNFQELYTNIFAAKNLRSILTQLLFAMLIGVAGAFVTGKPVLHFIYGFPIIYLITLFALVIAGNKQIKGLGLEAVIFSLCLGLLLGNLFKLPPWLKASLSSEFFVKIGLILLGTSIIFSDILKAGLNGLLQSVIVVFSVWYFAFWVCKKLKVDNEMGLMISSAVSICGVSAAIATSGAIKGDSKKLSYVISLVLITAIPMMIGMPYIAKHFGFSQELTGAWLGGTIDTTGAVVAAGSLVGDAALKISTIVKFSQNVLLGVAAFIISIYWTYTKKTAPGDVEMKPTLGIIWQRFPKFVLGFIGASLIFSFWLNAEIIGSVKDSLKSLQSLWFALAFTSIGLETNFADLIHVENRKPLYAFLIAQGFNVIITLVIAYFLFG